MKKIIFLLTIISTLSFGKVQVEEVCKEGYKLNISNEYIDVNNIKFDSLDFDLQKYKYSIKIKILNNIKNFIKNS